jgi:hypothetical protein
LREQGEKDCTAFLKKNLSLEMREELENKAVEVAEGKLPIGSFNRWVLENCYAGWEGLTDEDDGEPIEFKSAEDFGMFDTDVTQELVRIVLGRKRSIEVMEKELEAAKKIEAALSPKEEAEKN